MSKLSFSQKPKRVYYSYVKDGHIYSITSSKPSVISDGGGCYCCYFECDAYHKYEYTPAGESDAVVAYGRIYQNNGTDTNPSWVPVNAQSFHKGQYYAYYGVDNTDKVEKYIALNVTASGYKYYTKNGKAEYLTPNNATALPFIKYNDKTYYFDKLITNGAKYTAGTPGSFTPLDVNGTSGDTTFGYVIGEIVKDSININAFKVGVDELPEYLRGGHRHVKTGESACPNPCPFNEGEYDGSAYIPDETNTGYQLSADYLSLFGPLFMEKLCDVMKEKGDAIVEKYKENTIKTKYQDVVIEKPSAYTAGSATTVTYQISEKSGS